MPEKGDSLLILRLALLLVVAAFAGYRMLESGGIRPLSGLRQDAGSMNTGGVHDLGLVRVDERLRLVSFPAVVKPFSGKPRFFVHLRGYGWLEKDAILASEAKLAELQTALATLDWRLWDDLWHGRRSERTALVRLGVAHGGNELPAAELLGGGNLQLADLIFLGSPELDPLVLGESPNSDCSSCPLLDAEKTFIDGILRKSGGPAAFAVNAGKLPSPGSEVTVLIRCSTLP